MNFSSGKTTDTKSRALEFASVEKYMAKDEVTLTPNLSVNEAIDIILNHKVTGAPVLDNERKIIGMLTEKDCLRLLIDSAYNNMPFGDKKVSDYMSPVVKSVSVDSDILDVANEFLTTNFRKFPVVHNEKLVGQVSRRDILKAIDEMDNTTW